MARARANPDPMVEDFTPTAGAAAGRELQLHAFRDGHCEIHFAGKLVKRTASQLQSAEAGMGAPKYPSNRLQEEAMRYARVTANSLVEAVG
jgi:hypothetical protein